MMFRGMPIAFLRARRYLALLALTASSAVIAQEPITDLAARGEALFFERVSCWICHGENAEGLIGPSLLHGPTPMDIQEQLDSNPQMAVIVAELNPDADDLVSLASYIRSLSDIGVSAGEVEGWYTQLATMAAAREPETDFVITERDRLVMQIQSFATVLNDWQRRARSGSLKGNYAVRTMATFDAGEPVFHPEPGGLYFYENTGGTAGGRLPYDGPRNGASQVVVGDAVTKEILVSGQLPVEFRGSVHTTVLSPDARFVYIIGPPSAAGGTAQGGMAQGGMAQGGMAQGGMAQGGMAQGGGNDLRSSATLLKVDALTLKPVKQLDIGGRLHHGQIFQDKYLLMDTFVSDPDGLDIFLLDPETDQILGGVRGADLGGRNYTSFTDNEFIYVLMQPGAFEAGPPGPPPGPGGQTFNTVNRPYWVAKIDPETWEVVAEYPYPGYRGDWIVIDSRSEYMYVPAARSTNVSKINIATGAIEWFAPTGVGPYGAALNADESELWVSDKGESNGQFGRTITVIDADSGRSLHTLFSGYQGDHVLLSPDGKEMWSTSNGEGRIYVFDASTHEQTNVIDMPYRGSPHGLVWVHYDTSGNGRVVRDQGGFHNGVHPSRGAPLDGTEAR